MAAEVPLTAAEKKALIREKLDAGVIQIRSRNRWVMYDMKGLEKALARANADVAAAGGQPVTRQIRIMTAKDL